MHCGRVRLKVCHTHTQQHTRAHTHTRYSHHDELLLPLLLLPEANAAICITTTEMCKNVLAFCTCSSSHRVTLRIRTVAAFNN